MSQVPRLAAKTPDEPGMTFTDQRALLSHISKLLLQEEVDFVAYPVISVWHAVGVDALAYSISESGNRTTSGIVVITPHRKAGFLIGERDFACRTFASVRFLYLDVWFGYKAEERIIRRAKVFLGEKSQLFLVARKVRRQQGSHKTTLRVASPMNPNTGFLSLFANGFLADRYQPICWLLDEGLAGYMPGPIWNLNLKALGDSPTQSKRGEGPELVSHLVKPLSLLKRLIRVTGAKVAGVVGGLIELEMRTHIKVEKASLFRKEHGRLVPNGNVIEWYRQVIEKRSGVHAKVERRKPLAIIVTQPFAEYGRIPLPDELDVTNGVIDVLLRMEFDVLLKPHPRETADKYASTVSRLKLDQVRLGSPSVPVEQLLPALQPACVVGYTSTALPVASALYGIPSISLAGVMAPRTKDRYMRKHSHEFGRLTAEICCHARSFDELRDMLGSVVANNVATDGRFEGCRYS